MKKLVLCIAVVFAFAITSAAQETNPQSSSAGTSSQTSAGKKGTKSASSSKTTTGCVEKSGDGYVLKSSHYKNGVKVTSSDDLGPHVGHTVKLTGSWTTPGQEFNATKLDMVSDTCKMGGSSMSSTGKTGKKKGSSSGAAGSTPPPGF